MLDSNIILGTRGTLGCEDYAHGILTQEWEGWPCGTPIVYPDNAMKNSGGSMQAMSLMTVSQNSAGRETSSVATTVVSPVDMKPLCKNHKVLTVSAFDFGKFDRLREFVRDVGGLSLVIDYVEGRKKIVKALYKIQKSFNLSSLFYYNSWGSKHLQGEEDRYICVLTFLDLPYCVPIFNMRKVDGMGLSFSGATVKESESYGQLSRLFRTDIIYSNFEDNVFVIDGVEVNRPHTLSKEHRDNLIALTSQELPVGKAKKKSSSKEAKELSGYERYRKMGDGPGYVSGGVGASGGYVKDDYEVELKEWKTTTKGLEVKTNSDGDHLITNFPPISEVDAPQAQEVETEPSEAPELPSGPDKAFFGEINMGTTEDNIVWDTNSTVQFGGSPVINDDDEEEV